MGCNHLRNCYVKIDDENPKGYDFGWQCNLLKCIAYCLRHEEVCNGIKTTFKDGHCEKALEIDLPDCDVNCAGARRQHFIGVLAVVVIMFAAFSWAGQLRL